MRPAVLFPVRRLFLLAGLALALVPAAATAAPAEFVAADACPAFRSKNTRANPGNVVTEPGRRYDVLERNPDGEWVRIRVPGAPAIEERWVLADCGGGSSEVEAPLVVRGRESTRNVLAATWQPAFCEGEPGTRECRVLNRGELPEAAAGFSLHGLWPEGAPGEEAPAYCDASATARIRALDDAGRWSALPPVPLSESLQDRLAAAMPGVASGLDRHEWHSHGSCFRDPDGADGYFADSLRLLDALNASPAARFVAANAGRTVALADLEAAFDASFGPGSARKMRFTCRPDDGRTLLREVVIPLAGRIDAGTTLADLVAAASPARGRDSCPRRIAIDGVGLQ